MDGFKESYATMTIILLLKKKLPLNVKFGQNKIFAVIAR
jgi:hypothetical protein